MDNQSDKGKLQNNNSNSWQIKNGEQILVT